MNENVPAATSDDDVEEEAEAALSTVDSEFGRTTDPVRMYMREMGSVELLTREGEIEIAKRIEDGLKHMVQAISACPTTIAEILAHGERIRASEMPIDEVVDGLIDPTAGGLPDRRRRRRGRGRRRDDRHRRVGHDGRAARRTEGPRARQVRPRREAVRQDAGLLREGRLQVARLPEGAAEDPRRADEPALHGQDGRAAVRTRCAARSTRCARSRSRSTRSP